MITCVAQYGLSHCGYYYFDQNNNISGKENIPYYELPRRKLVKVQKYGVVIVDNVIEIVFGLEVLGSHIAWRTI